MLLVPAPFNSGGIEYVGRGTLGKVTTSGSGSVPLPTGLQQYDLMVMVTAKSNISTMSTPAGWTAIGTSPNGLDLFYKIAGSSESAPSVSANTFGFTAAIYAWRGADQSTPIDTSAQSTTTPGSGFPVITTTVAGCPVLMSVTGTGLGSYAIGSAGNLTGYAEELDDQNDGASVDFTLAVYLGTMASAGSIGSPAATPTSQSSYGCMSIAIRPAA